MSEADDADPLVDGKECTSDLCVGGTPSNPPLDAGTSCGAGGLLKCNAAGDCGCQGDQDCNAPATCGGGNPGTPLVCGCTKTTCLAQGATCGSISDGCGGSLDCDDHVQNGGEVGVDCGGPVASCSTRCAQGRTCLAASDCGSGYCVDGVCCGSACTGTCQACSAARKGSGFDGVCGTTRIGTDPDDECSDQGAASCGTSGSCDGSGACQRYPAGTVCSLAYECGGAGTCPTACGPSNASGDASCVSHYYCDGVGPGACQPANGTGSACARGRECASGVCASNACQ
jgi:hypothetical protein